MDYNIKMIDKNRILAHSEMMESLVVMVKQMTNLQHLDISYMGLGDKMFPICQAINENKSVLSVHLGDNNISKDLLDKILFNFGIDKKSIPTSLTGGFGMMDSVDQMDQANDLNSIVDYHLQHKAPQQFAKEVQPTVRLPHILQKEIN
jgi:hypothetical protein